MTMFLLVYLSVFLGVHALFFFRIRVFFADKAVLQWLVILLLLLMVFMPMAAYMLERAGQQTPSRIAATAGFYWMGFIFLAFVGSLLFTLYDLTALCANTVLPLLSRSAPSVPYLHGKIPALILIAGACMCCAYGLYSARNIRIERLRIVTDKLPRHIERFTVAQISDVHLGLILREGFLESLVSELEQLSPDLLVCTGDLIDSSPENLLHMAENIRELQPLYGKYAVTGNHEYYAGLDHSLAFLRESGFTVLMGESRSVRDVINIAGVEDSYRSGARSSEGAQPATQSRDFLGGTSPERYTILLRHRPEIVEEWLGRFDLQLSGHTHGGQIFPFNHMVERQYPFISGAYTLGKGSMLYVNRGTGTWGPPMRILAPPEITLIELVRKEGA